MTGLEDLIRTQDYLPLRYEEHLDESAPKFRLIPHAEIMVGSQAVYLIEGILPRTGVTVIWGPSGCGKSFITQDLVMHIAMGWAYRGRRTKEGTVIYFAAEGASGFRARVEAFRREKLVEADRPPFYMIDATISLIKDHSELVRSIRVGLSEGEPAVVVLDTLNRTFDGSESSDEAMTAYVNAAHAIKTAFGCAVIIVHHSGHNTERMRGHTALLGAADASISVKHDASNNIVMAVEKMKDGTTGDEFVSRLKSVNVGVDENGEAISSCVVEPVDLAPAAKSAQNAPKLKVLTKSGKTALTAITRAMDEVGEVPPACSHIPADVKCVTIEQWRNFAYRTGISTSSEARARQQAFKRASEELIGEGHVVVWDPYAWTLKR